MDKIDKEWLNATIAGVKERIKSFREVPLIDESTKRAILIIEKVFQWAQVKVDLVMMLTVSYWCTLLRDHILGEDGAIETLTILIEEHLKRFPEHNPEYAA